MAVLSPYEATPFERLAVEVRLTLPTLPADAPLPRRVASPRRTADVLDDDRGASLTSPTGSPDATTTPRRLGVGVFVTYDARQASAAVLAGLVVQAPGTGDDRAPTRPD